MIKSKIYRMICLCSAVVCMFIINTSIAFCVEFGSEGEGTDEVYTPCGRYNGCLGEYGWRFRIIHNTKKTNDKFTYTEVTGTKKYEYHFTFDFKTGSIYRDDLNMKFEYNDLKNEIFKGGVLFKKILSETNITEKKFIDNNYYILVEPLFFAIYDPTKVDQNKIDIFNVNTYLATGDAKTVAKAIYQKKFDIYGNYHKYYLNGITGNTYDLPCSVYLPPVSGNDSLCSSTDISVKREKQKEYLEKVMATDSRYAKALISAKDIPKGSIQITKTDEDGKGLAGAKFALYKDSSCSTVLEDNIIVDKTATIKNLVVGTYYVKEKAAPAGYSIGDGACKPIKVEANKTKKITFTNKKIPTKGSIKIIKTDESGNQLDGAKFALYKDSSCSTVLKDNITVNKTATIKNLVVGTYYVKEKAAPAGYSIGDGACKPIKVEANKTNEITFENKKITIKVSFLKVNSSGNNITSDNVIIRLYKGNTNCSGNNYDEHDFTTKKEISLNVGSYSVKEIEAPEGYKLDSSTCHTIVISNSGEVTIDGKNETTLKIKNEKKGCQDDLNDYITAYKSEASIPPEKLIELFNKYKGTKGFESEPPYGLLNFTKPRCSVEKTCSSFNVGCLSANETNNNFNEKNISCYDRYETDSNGNYVAFCKKNLELKNVLGVSKFYSNSGEFLIKYVGEDNYIYYYSLEDAAKNKIKLERSFSNLISYATHTETCYYVGGNSNKPSSKTTNLEVYFGDNDSNGAVDKLSKNNWDSITYGPYKTNGLNLIIYIDDYYFSLKENYLDRLTGKATSSKDVTQKITGIVSPFNKKSGTIPFKLEYNGKTYSSNSCTYQTFEELIAPKLELEFRTVDTNNPFVGKSESNRNTNTNWCSGSDCSSNNNVVKSKIKNSTNSYGMKNGTMQDPIYKITLTPDDIKQIRKYNKENKYDNYATIKVTQSGKQKYVNKFLYELFNKQITVNGSKENTKMKLEGEIKYKDVNVSDELIPPLASQMPTHKAPTYPGESTSYVVKTYEGIDGSLGSIKSSTSGYNNISSGNHTFQLNLSSRLKSCVGYNQKTSVTGKTTTWTANDTCKINLTTLVPEPADPTDTNVYRYYYTYSVTLENGKTYKSCMRVAIYRMGAYGVINRDAEVKPDNCCLDPNFGEWHKNNC